MSHGTETGIDKSRQEKVDERMLEIMCAHYRPDIDDIHKKKRSALTFLSRLVTLSKAQKSDEETSSAYAVPLGSEEDIVGHCLGAGILEREARWFAGQIVSNSIRAEQLLATLARMTSHVDTSDRPQPRVRKKPAPKATEIKVPNRKDFPVPTEAVLRLKGRQKETLANKGKNFAACSESIIDYLKLRPGRNAVFKDIRPFVEEALTSSGVSFLPEHIGAALQRLVKEKRILVRDLPDHKWEYVLADEE